jgi:prolyl-tRNA synthetase
MYYSKLFPKTRRKDPKDATSPGTRLLIRGGYIDQVSRGIWITTSLGLKVRRKIEMLVRKQMELIGAMELEIPILQPRIYWEETGRWEKYVKAQIAFHLFDRKNVEYILSPTAEEVVTHFARTYITGIRDLPITFWQMGPKFRDELRPRQGIVRGREFIMKDAYSFDPDERGMRLSYKAMSEAYQNIFEQCGFNFIKVEADSGAIGGSGSAEFMAITEYGEDTLLYCPSCGYGGNQEKASVFYAGYQQSQVEFLCEIETPDIKTVEGLEQFTGVPTFKMVKTIVLLADGNPVIVSIRGDLEISEIKLANLIRADVIEMATPEIVKQVTKAPVGFAGPINLFGKTEFPYYFDVSIQGLQNFLCGANKTDVHYLNVNTGRDFPEVFQYVDLAKATAGHNCANCKTGILAEKHGIELGHIFQLQQTYSRKMNAVYKNQNDEEIPYFMGCYGIGVSRMVQAIAEQRYDSRGIIWPIRIAPFIAVIIPAKPEYMSIAKTIHEFLTSKGIDVVLDDRSVRMGEKLTDAELQGWPLQIIVGRDWHSEEKLEVRLRNTEKFDQNIFSISDYFPTGRMSLDTLLLFIIKINSN